MKQKKNLRHLLEQVQERLDPHRDATLWGELCEALKELSTGAASIWSSQEGGREVAAWRWLYDGKCEDPYAFNCTPPSKDVIELAAKAERPRTVEYLYVGPAPEGSDAQIQKAECGECERLGQELCERNNELSALRAELAALKAQQESFCEYCGGNDEEPQDHCMDCTRPQPAPAQNVVELNSDDLKIDTWGTGPAHGFDTSRANTVRVTHKPTGISVERNTERSQYANKEAAYQVLRILVAAHDKQSGEKKS